MTSELQHVEALKTVVVDYVQPLRTQLPKDTIKKLFGNIEVILQWNMQFYGRLRSRYEESEDMSMDSNVDDHEFLFGDIMVEMVRLLSLRASFSGKSDAQLTYERYSERHQICNFHRTDALFPAQIVGHLASNLFTI